ncbi:MAG TPA: serine hydrolase domain-containing protein, partial [Candidatus Saccharimonadales bacterium]|nr:serine hydrolase domain-containing protein [Candidatus Saccharimonadales bacterium]
KRGRKTILPFGNFTYDTASPSVTASTVYDLASITKPIPTMSIMLSLIEQGAFSLDTKVIDYLPEISAPGRDAITIRHLLTYTLVFDIHSGSHYATSDELLRALCNSPLANAPGSTFVYTNMSAYLAGFVAEKATAKRLDELASEMFFAPLDMTNTTFTPAKNTVAPTENGVEPGDVHDETARAMRQNDIIAGHAGLFSTADDLLTFASMLLNKGELNGKQYFTPKTVAQMRTNQLADIGEKWSLGWAIPDGQFDFFGSQVSDQAFGMTGFTGTSILIDPTKDCALVVLSNATFPVRKNDKEIMNRVRRDLADVVFGSD